MDRQCYGLPRRLAGNSVDCARSVWLASPVGGRSLPRRPTEACDVACPTAWRPLFWRCRRPPGRTDARAAQPVLADTLAAAAPAANPKVLALAARAAECARKQGVLDGFRHLAVIDYSLPSTQPRLWVFDVERGRLMFQELVAHGRNTGDAKAERFSNAEGSHMSSIGLFKTLEPYYGSNGYSLRLSGLDPGFNDNALARAIVMHGAPYVSEAIAERLGRLGRSWGCPAVRPEVARTVIDTLKGGALLFAYYPDRKWLDESPYFQCDGPPGRRWPALARSPAAAELGLATRPGAGRRLATFCARSRI